VIVDELVLDPYAVPPKLKFGLLAEIDRKFVTSWNHQRPDLTDQSPSAFDLSLAVFAAIIGWSDQEIVNLLIAHRRRHGADLKLRPDYYRMTIRKARIASEKYWKGSEPWKILPVS